MMSFREAFELWNNMEFYKHNDRAKKVYEKFHGQSAPEASSLRLPGFPTALKTVAMRVWFSSASLQDEQI